MSLQIPTDTLLAIFSYRNLPERIPIKAIHHSIYLLQKEEKYNRWLEPFNFTEGPETPLSEELEVTLSRLCSSGLCFQSEGRYLEIPHESRVAMRQSLERHLKSQEIEELERLIPNFYQLVMDYKSPSIHELLSKF